MRSWIWEKYIFTRGILFSQKSYKLNQSPKSRRYSYLTTRTPYTEYLIRVRHGRVVIRAARALYEIGTKWQHGVGLCNGSGLFKEEKYELNITRVFFGQAWHVWTLGTWAYTAQLVNIFMFCLNILENETSNSYAYLTAKGFNLTESLFLPNKSEFLSKFF